MTWYVRKRCYCKLIAGLNWLVLTSSYLVFVVTWAIALPIWPCGPIERCLRPGGQVGLVMSSRCLSWNCTTAPWSR